MNKLKAQTHASWPSLKIELSCTDSQKDERSCDVLNCATIKRSFITLGFVFARVQSPKPLDSQSMGFSRFKDESEGPTSDLSRLKGYRFPAKHY